MVRGHVRGGGVQDRCPDPGANPERTTEPLPRPAGTARSSATTAPMNPYCTVTSAADDQTQRRCGSVDKDWCRGRVRARSGGLAWLLQVGSSLSA